MNGILTVQQVAEKLQVNQETVYRWLRNGKLIGYRANRLWRIAEESLQRFLERGQRPGGTRGSELKKRACTGRRSVAGSNRAEEIR